MRNTLVRGLVALVVWWGAAQGVAARAEEYPASRLPGQVGVVVARALEQRVTYTATEATLGEILRDIGALTGADLLAMAPASERKVSIAVSDVSLREFLEDVAVLFGYKWRAGGSILLLSPPTAQDLPRLDTSSPGPPDEKVLETMRSLATSFTPEQLEAVAAGGLPFSALSAEQQTLVAWYVDNEGLTSGTWPDGAPLLVPNSAWRITRVVTDPAGVYVIDLDSGRVTREGFVPLRVFTSVVADLRPEGEEGATPIYEVTGED